MKKKRSDITLGVVLVVVGTVALLTQLNVIKLGWNIIWPMIVLGMGLAFHASAWVGGRRSSGLLVPGGIFVTYGALFLVCALAGWRHMGTLWPLFIMGPGIGLLELYLFGKRKRGLLVPVFILLGIGTGFLFLRIFAHNYQLVLSVCAVVAGLVYIAVRLFGREQPARPTDPGDEAAAAYDAAPRYTPPQIPRYAPPVYPQPPRDEEPAAAHVREEEAPVQTVRTAESVQAAETAVSEQEEESAAHGQAGHTDAAPAEIAVVEEPIPATTEEDADTTRADAQTAE